MSYKKIFLNSKNPAKSSYLWNAFAAMLFALQSAFMLIIITRTNGLDDAGIFSIAYAVASLMSFIGEFGVRKYQVSDVNEIHGFTDYYTFKLISCVGMIIACALYSVYGLFINGYTIKKFLVVVTICLIKLADTFVEVFHGRFQQKGRLDVGAKCDIFRVVIGVSSCIISLTTTHDLLLSCVIWLIAVVFAVLVSTLAVAPKFCEIKIKSSYAAIRHIFIECFPIFIGSFLLIYVGNAPKYAIDAIMDDESQACYGFIFMPVFVISLLANFILNPILVDLSKAWAEKDYKTFDSRIARQAAIILGLTVLAIVVALTIGCPVLGKMYNTDLSSYRYELSILMIGGGMLAIANFINVIVTVIRYQKYLLIGYILVSAAAAALSNIFVSKSGLTGAAILYTSLMSLLGISFTVIFLVCRKKAIRKRETE